MKLRTFSILTLVALLVSVAPLTAQDDSEGFPRTVIDGAGREVTFDAPPERLVTYYNDSFGMLATLGVMPVAQSVNPEMLSDPIYFGEAGTAIPTITYDDGPDLEEVAAAEPDLVLVFSEEEAQALDGIAPAFVTPDASNLEELYDAVGLYGELLGLEQEAADVISAFDDRLSAYQMLAPADVSVLKLGVMGENSFWISTLDDPLCQILNTLADCGWESPMETEFWGYEGTTESVLNLDPDVIILNNWTDNSYEDLATQLSNDPLWGELSAVQNDRILSTPGYDNPIASSLPALRKFLDVYMPLLYPDIFDGPLTDEQVQEILADQERNEEVSTDSFPVTVTDMTGRELTFDAPPQRVICLLNRCAEELAFIGVVPVAVGAPYTYNVALNPMNFGETAETFGQIPQTDGIDWEQVASYEPDLIMGDAEMLAAAEGIAPLYAYSWDVSVWETTENFTTDVRNFGRIFGVEAEVEAKLQGVLDRVAAYATLSPNNRTYLGGFFNDAAGSSMWLQVDCGLFLSQLIPCGSEGEDWIEGTVEVLLSFNPDVLVIEQYSVDDEAATIESLNESNPLWNELTAVKNGEVYLVPVSQARPNTIQSVSGVIDTLMPLIYPDIFPDGPLTDEQVQEVLAKAESE